MMGDGEGSVGVGAGRGDSDSDSDKRWLVQACSVRYFTGSASLVGVGEWE